jgi:NADH-quinone oxidoreductase subunit J
MELTLFIIVGTIAVVAAAMMLISENAVYSALFLILNFACIAFFFLMLNAPFLAMVQITVYAGAIMVLFLFVIMLLGAERVFPGDNVQFRWLTPVAVILALVFLIAASAAIIDGDIDLIEPRQDAPHVRAVHALDGAGALDFYLDGERIAEAVAYQDSSDFELWDTTGQFTARLFEAGADSAAAEPLAEQMVEVNEGEALSFVAIAGRPGDPGPHLVVATEDVTFNDESGTLRVIAVNALPRWPLIDVVDVTSGEAVLLEDVPYGKASEGVLLDKGKRTIGVYPDGEAQNRLVQLSDEQFDDNTSALWVVMDERQPDNSFESRILDFEVTGSPSFGSPTHIGRLLFTRYVLPFEMVALLLLVAMIGAIVLTHEALAPRERMVRRLANPPAGLDQPIIGKPDK